MITISSLCCNFARRIKKSKKPDFCGGGPFQVVTPRKKKNNGQWSNNMLNKQSQVVTNRWYSRHSGFQERYSWKFHFYLEHSDAFGRPIFCGFSGNFQTHSSMELLISQPFLILTFHSSPMHKAFSLGTCLFGNPIFLEDVWSCTSGVGYLNDFEQDLVSSHNSSGGRMAWRSTRRTVHRPGWTSTQRRPLTRPRQRHQQTKSQKTCTVLIIVYYSIRFYLPIDD